MSLRNWSQCLLCFFVGVVITSIFSTKVEIKWIPVEKSKPLRVFETVSDDPKKIKFTQKMSYIVIKPFTGYPSIEQAIGKKLHFHIFAKSYRGHIEQPLDMEYEITAVYWRDYPWWQNIFLDESTCFILEDELKVRSVVCGFPELTI